MSMSCMNGRVVMKNVKRLLLYGLLVLAPLAGSWHGAFAAMGSVGAPPGEEKAQSVPCGQGRIQSWSLSFDNDILVPSSRDQDYTYGVSIAASGPAIADGFWFIHEPLAALNENLGSYVSAGNAVTHSVEFGIYGFTPEDIAVATPNHDDRPYASLAYLSASQEQPGVQENVVWRSALTLGVLGLDIAGQLQNEVHRRIDSQIAEGWEHQVSDGGELTARYTLARQTLWTLGNPNLEVKTSWMGSVGYITELGYGTSIRFGRIASRWQSYNPELTQYREQASQAIAGKCQRESYFVAGVALKLRAYNAFLQGQFRDSEVAYSSSELEHGIVEAWMGYTHAFAGGYRISYVLRGHSSEVKEGAGDRNVMWGGLTLAQHF
ncbi:MAG: lipid A deacylase LpxR family protein [Ketobacter sp.]|nr:MAG: lipid A deacylase LpxR family protein [Ketobacter sp.]